MRQIMRSSLDYAGFAQLCARSPIMRKIMRAHNRIIQRSLPACLCPSFTDIAAHGWLLIYSIYVGFWFHVSKLKWYHHLFKNLSNLIVYIKKRESRHHYQVITFCQQYTGMKLLHTVKTKWYWRSCYSSAIVTISQNKMKQIIVFCGG